MRQWDGNVVTPKRASMRKSCGFYSRYQISIKDSVKLILYSRIGHPHRKASFGVFATTGRTITVGRPFNRNSGQRLNFDYAWHSVHQDWEEVGNVHRSHWDQEMWSQCGYIPFLSQVDAKSWHRPRFYIMFFLQQPHWKWSWGCRFSTSPTAIRWQKFWELSLDSGFHYLHSSMSLIHTNALYPVFVVVILSSGQALLLRTLARKPRSDKFVLPLLPCGRERERETWAQDIVLHHWACLDPPRQRRTTRPAQKSYHVLSSFGPGDVCLFVAVRNRKSSCLGDRDATFGQSYWGHGLEPMIIWKYVWRRHGEWLMISIWKRDDDY